MCLKSCSKCMLGQCVTALGLEPCGLGDASSLLQKFSKVSEVLLFTLSVDVQVRRCISCCCKSKCFSL